MKLIVGLGNPGKKYENTRHNVGFIVIDKFYQNNGFSEWKGSKRFKAKFCKAKGVTEQIILAKPETFMNKSGQAVRSLAAFYKIKPHDIWVLHDEIDLPTGKLRISQNASAGGHNGIKSIIEELGTSEFVRFRIGVAGQMRVKISAEKYVLQKFSKEEKAQIDEFLKFAVQAINTALISGITEAQNEYN